MIEHIDANIWRIEERDGKKFKFKWHDSLTYKQWRMTGKYWECIPFFLIKKNETKWRNKIMRNGLSDYVFGVEIKGEYSYNK
jgi:hypothetical protein